jgi:hypothetical protein
LLPLPESGITNAPPGLDADFIKQIHGHILIFPDYPKPPVSPDFPFASTFQDSSNEEKIEHINVFVIGPELGVDEVLHRVQHGRCRIARF